MDMPSFLPRKKKKKMTQLKGGYSVDGMQLIINKIPTRATFDQFVAWVWTMIHSGKP